MIWLSFDTELNRDIGVGYFGIKADVCFLKYVHPTNRANERNPIVRSWLCTRGIQTHHLFLDYLCLTSRKIHISAHGSPAWLLSVQDLHTQVHNSVYVVSSSFST